MTAAISQRPANTEEAPAVDDSTLDRLFRKARTHNVWTERAVSDATLHELYDLMKMSPTSANMCPVRILFLRSVSAKERLRPALAPGNLEKTMTAPVCAVIAHDLEFHDHLARLFPQKDMAGMFRDNPVMAAEAAFRNGTLQGGYFILAARAVGLDCGPMSGFDNSAVDAEFFAGTSTKSNFLCNLGYGDASGLWPRAPRFEFREVCDIL